MSDLTAITRKEKIISGEDLKPITREEMFLQKYRGSGGGGGASVQPDWNENNETSAAFVKNRTHYVIPGIETKTNKLTWDGDTTGKEAADSGDGTLLVKVSDSVCTADDLIGGTVIMNMGGHEMSAPITAEMVRDMSSVGFPQIAVLVDGESAVSIVTEDFSAEGLFVTKGIYFVHATFEGQTAYISSLIAVTDCFVLKTPETVKPLDGKFLPNGLGYIIKEGTQTKTNTLTFDGNIEGKEVVMDLIYPFVKMTDSILAVDDLIGATVVLSAGEDIFEILTIDAVQDLISDSDMPMPAITAKALQAGVPVLLSFYQEFGSFKKGTYFIWVEEEGGVVYTKSLTCLTDCFVLDELTEVQKIDNRLLDVEWLATKTVTETPILENVSLDLAYDVHNDPPVAATIFVSGDEKYFELVVGQNYSVIWDGTKYENLKAVEVDGVVVIGDISFSRTYPFIIGTFFDGAVGVLRVIAYANSDITVNVSIAEAEYGYNKLPEEYLPETLLATIASLEARIAELEGATE